MPQNPNLTFRSNWYGRLPHHVDLARLAPADRAVLEAADTRIPHGVLTMDEARDYLIHNSQVRTDAAARELRAVLDRLLSTRADAAVNCLDPALPKQASEVCYVQLNNAANADLREARDLRAIVKQDTDAPTLALLNLTAGFNAGDFAQATAAFTTAMRRYFDGLIAKDARMGGFIISGHSNGRDFLQEVGEHMYRAKLRPRDVLSALRNERPEYARLMDRCEKVGLLGCFNGGAKEEWGQLFPNAVVVGTTEFAPAASSPASAELYAMASRGEQRFERDWRTTAAAAIGETRSGPWRTELGGRGVTMRVPGNVGLDEAQRMFETAKRAFDGYKDTIRDIREHPAAHPQADLERAYSVANSYLQAREQLWVLDGRRDAQEAKTIQALDFLKDDLFAIRKHYPNRPAVPAGVDVALAFA